jgi:hypothetical protein
MNSVTTQSMALASADTLEELLSDDVNREGSFRSRSAPIDARLMADYLDALRRGVVLSG